ncbi:hypothetical protein BBJ28_00014084, partial [Nothophytophthora sp. Chile5]
YDEFRTKTLSDCSDMSDDDDNDNFEILTARYDGASSLTADELNIATPASSEAEEKAGVAFVMDEGALNRYHRGAEERTRQRAQGRNIREALQMAPDQSRIKYLEQLLSESVARELRLEAELDSVLDRAIRGGSSNGNGASGGGEGSSGGGSGSNLGGSGGSGSGYGQV